MAEPVDLFLAYNFLKRLVTPWTETQAFKLGLIDAEGKRLRYAKTGPEKAATGYFDRLIFNLKRLLQTIPGGQSKLATYAAALLLLREQDWKLLDDVDILHAELRKEIDTMDMSEYNRLDAYVDEILEDAMGGGAPTNNTAGASVTNNTQGPMLGGKKIRRLKKTGRAFV